MAMLEKVVNVVEEDSLLERTKNAGIVLLNHLKELTVTSIQLNIHLNSFLVYLLRNSASVKYHM